MRAGGRRHCGSIRAGDVGSMVEVFGWVARRRDHGGLIFIDVRDRWGSVQVVVNPALTREAHEVASELRGEYVVRVKGTVGRRPPGSENPKLATGEVEIGVSDLEILSRSKTPPFPIEDDQEADEKLRLRYRYLDLRRPRMLRMLELRHRVNKIIHAHMDAAEFVEVETPLLIKSTPEGARDFLVPSRVHTGKFFALPQSPQTLKQLLMVAGLGRYYQLARCLRDEDLRADRQLEFTQLDIEMSFCSEEDIFALVEGLLSRIWREILGVELGTPFRRLSIRDALLRYGTDKPDLRYGLEITDLGEVLASTQARVFREALDGGGVVRALCVPSGSDLTRRELDELVTVARGAGGKGLVWLPGGPVDKFLSRSEQVAIQQATGAGDGDLVLAVADRRRRAEKVIGLLRSEVARRRGLIKTDQWQFLWIQPTYLFEEDDDGNLTYGHHPFTRPLAEDLHLAEERPYDVRAHAYDIVCNGHELGGGSLRIYDRGMQERVFTLLGLDMDTVRERFGFLLEAFEFGVPPHGGIAWGVDRVVMLLGGTENIREVIAFPKTQTHQDLMLDAPGSVDSSQLAELGLQLTPPRPDSPQTRPV